MTFEELHKKLLQQPIELWNQKEVLLTGALPVLPFLGYTPFDLRYPIGPVHAVARAGDHCIAFHVERPHRSGNEQAEAKLRLRLRQVKPQLLVRLSGMRWKIRHPGWLDEPLFEIDLRKDARCLEALRPYLDYNRVAAGQAQRYAEDRLRGCKAP